MKKNLKLLVSLALVTLTFSIPQIPSSQAMERETERIPNTKLHTNVVYNIKHRVSSAHLDANGEGTKVYMLGNAQQDNPYQQWSFLPAGNNFYNIKHRASGAHLDANESGTEVYMLGNAQQNNQYQQWSLVPAGGNFYNIKHRVSNAHLDAKGNGKEVYMLGNAQPNNQYQ